MEKVFGNQRIGDWVLVPFPAPFPTPVYYDERAGRQCITDNGLPAVSVRRP